METRKHYLFIGKLQLHQFKSVSVKVFLSLGFDRSRFKNK